MDAPGRTFSQRLRALFPGGQFVRYLSVGLFNTLFGFTAYAVTLTLLNNVLPQRYLYLTVVAASLISTPISITVAYFGYKLFVFRTRGNHLVEWLKCFAVYGTGQIPGLVALSAITKLLQSLFHRHTAALHATLTAVESHLHGSMLTTVQHLATGKAMAGYLAGAIVMGFTTIYSFLAHKKITFATKRTAAPPSTQ